MNPFYDDALAARPPARRRERAARTAQATSRQNDFYTAFPEGADPEGLGVVRRPRAARSAVSEPAARARAATRREGSSLTRRSARTRAARSPSTARRSSRRTSPRPRFVCPCHYSTFDPGTGGDVTFGPAGRQLPMLPLLIDRQRPPPRRRELRRARRPVLVGRPHAGPDVIRKLVRFLDERTGDGARSPARRCGTCSRTTGRSCSARSRSTASSSCSRRGSTSRSSTTTASTRSSTTARTPRSRGST